ncbi:MAG TPA: hypothetical protein IGS52_00240 [Oscillatoriaceae cyanobacterium M33_DOE_052]|nr:hypothetical protein [Oscillatoriaceae cyanobacterium M33_DOE_052]
MANPIPARRFQLVSCFESAIGSLTKPQPERGEYLCLRLGNSHPHS